MNTYPIVGAAFLQTAFAVTFFLFFAKYRDSSTYTCDQPLDKFVLAAASLNTSAAVIMFGLACSFGKDRV